MQKNVLFSKTLELWCLLMTYRKLCKLNWTFQRTHYWIPPIQDGWDRPSWKSTWRHFFSAKGGPIWIKFRRLVQNDMSIAVMCGNGNHMYNSNMADVWANSMACHPRATYHIATWWIRCHEFQSHMPHCRVQSPGEINVVILPHCPVWEFHPAYWKSFFAIFYLFFCFVFNAA